MDYFIFFILLSAAITIKGNMYEGYQGCFEDSTHNRVLNGEKYILDVNGPDICSNVCIRKGFRYAGTGYGKFCFCGNEILNNKTSDECDILCRGNPEKICGGPWKLSLYDTWICATEKPCKYNGSCSDIDKSNYKCICTEQWTGMNCSQDPVSTTIITTTTTTLIYTTTTEQPLKSTCNDTMNDNRNRSKTTQDLKDGLDEDKKSYMNPLYLLIPCCVVLVMIAFIIGVIIYYRRWKSRGNNENEMVLQERESSGRTDNVVQEYNNIADENTASYQDLHASPIAEGYYFELNN